MGRKYQVKTEPVTSLSAYVVDSMIIDDFQKGGESKADALRRIFIKAFGESVIQEKKEELRKKIYLQSLSQSDGDQLMLDNQYQVSELKDLGVSRAELRQLIIVEKDWIKNPLAKLNADESIAKALYRGDATQLTNGLIHVVRKWYLR
jgi:hypothetical protein